MFAMDDAQRVAVLNLLRCAYGRGKAGEAKPFKARNLEQSEAIERRIIGNARNCQISRRSIETIGRNAVRVMLPIEPSSRIVHHSGADGPGVTDGKTTRGIVRDSLGRICAVGETGQRWLLVAVRAAHRESSEDLLFWIDYVIKPRISLINVSASGISTDVIVGKPIKVRRWVEREEVMGNGIETVS